MTTGSETLTHSRTAPFSAIASAPVLPMQGTKPFVLSVLIPVYNEKETLLHLLEKMAAVPIPMEWILVNDGSTDGTVEMLEQVAKLHPQAKIVHHSKNQGKGAAIVTALRHATGDFVIVQDADLEYDPHDYIRLLAPILSGEADVVYGSRFAGKVRGMKAANLLANRILTVATNLLFPRAHITDEATCYKLFRRTVLERFSLNAKRFDFCPEVTAKTLRAGIKIHEVPIEYRARTVAEGKKIHWQDGFQALWTLIKYRFVG